MYNFYSEKELENIKPVSPSYLDIKSPVELYELLSNGGWTIETCAPRLRELFNEENKTVGQCSITSFLVQDIFGGLVYGVPLEDGSVHCFNVVEGIKFDLTSEQFGDTKLEYTFDFPQSRLTHFADLAKFKRYLLLRSNLNKLR